MTRLATAPRTPRAVAALLAALTLTGSLAVSGCASLADLGNAEPSFGSATTSSSEADVTPDSPTAVTPVTDVAMAPGTAVELLETIPVKGRATKTGYDRKGKFGSPWLDVDRNGCDTRNDILQRDLTDLALAGPCKVLSGTLADKYTGQTINFVRGNTTSTLVQIDHVVALSDAWQKGAQSLTQEQRVALANDPLNLWAADGKANSSKGAGDAATWLPKNREFRCEYVARQVSVKASYSLWVTSAEKAAITRILEDCPDEPAVTGELAAQRQLQADDTGQPLAQPDSAPEQPAQTAPLPVAPMPVAPPTPDVYYKNCTAARAAGGAPVYAGMPGYGRHLDRDGDGVGCE